MPGLLQNTLSAVVADPRTRSLSLTWGGGAVTRYEMGPLIAAGGVFAALDDPDRFTTVAIGPRGRSLVWPGDVDLDADALWFDAHPEDNPYARPDAAE